MTLQETRDALKGMSERLNYDERASLLSALAWLDALARKCGPEYWVEDTRDGRARARGMKNCIPPADDAPEPKPRLMVCRSDQSRLIATHRGVHAEIAGCHCTATDVPACVPATDLEIKLNRVLPEQDFEKGATVEITDGAFGSAVGVKLGDRFVLTDVKNRTCDFSGPNGVRCAFGMSENIAVVVVAPPPAEKPDTLQVGDVVEYEGKRWSIRSCISETDGRKVLDNLLQHAPRLVTNEWLQSMFQRGEIVRVLKAKEKSNG